MHDPGEASCFPLFFARRAGAPPFRGVNLRLPAHGLGDRLAFVVAACETGRALETLAAAPGTKLVRVWYGIGEALQ